MKLRITRKKIPILGPAKITWTHTAVYVNLFSFFFITATFYKTTGVDWFRYGLKGWDPGFPIFLLFIVVALALFSFLFIYRYDVPSSLGWYFDQLCTFGDVYSKDIKELKEEIHELRSLIKDLSIEERNKEKEVVWY